MDKATVTWYDCHWTREIITVNKIKLFIVVSMIYKFVGVTCRVLTRLLLLLLLGDDKFG